MSRQSTLLSALGVVLITALWWMFIMSPQREKVATIEEAITAAQAEAITLQAQVSELEGIRSVAPQVEAQIATLRGVVPDSINLPSALRQIQGAADDAGLTIGQLTNGLPAPLPGGEALGLHASQVSLSATGSYFQIVDFLRRLEDPTITARGIDVLAVAVSPVGEYPDLTLILTGRIFSVLETAAIPLPPAPEPTVAPTEES